MLVIGVIVVVAFSLTAMSFQHWGFGQRAHNRQVARNMAASVASLAAARLIADPALGAPVHADDTVTYADPDNPGASAVVTFVPAEAARLGIACSLNNQTETSVDGAGSRVPRRTAQILAHGQCRGATAEVEMMLYVPPYPLALIASGPLTSTGGLVVSAIRDARDYQPDLSALPASKKAMATVASNDGGELAVELGPGAVINGNLQAVGQIKLAPDDVVKGAVMPQSNPAPLPDLDVSRALAACDTPQRRSWSIPAATRETDMHVEWMRRCEGSLQVDGDLTMDGATLVVTGDLHVTGSVKGKGSIVAGGAITIDRGADFDADNVVAVLAHGPITLSGVERAHSFLQGVVYSETSIRANHLTVLGTVMTKALPGQGAIALDDVSVVCAPVTVQTRFGLPASSGADDDESVWSATAYPDPADPTGKALRFDVSLISYSNDLHPNQQYQGGGSNLTRKQAEDLILQLDLRAPHPGATGHNISNDKTMKGVPCVEILHQYFDKLEASPPDSSDMLNLDMNRLLKPAAQPRVLLWRYLRS
jgi:cytoskeletal protein CcmA (bactofilin family)